MKNNIKLLYISPSLCFSALLLTACTSAPPVAGDGQSPSDTSAPNVSSTTGSGVSSIPVEEEKEEDEQSQSDNTGAASEQEEYRKYVEQYYKEAELYYEDRKRVREDAERVREDAERVREEEKQQEKDKTRRELEKACVKVKEAHSCVERARDLHKEMDKLVGWATKTYASRNNLVDSIKNGKREFNRNFEKMCDAFDEAGKHGRKARSTFFSDGVHKFSECRRLSEKAVSYAQKVIDSFALAETGFNATKSSQLDYLQKAGLNSSQPK